MTAGKGALLFGAVIATLTGVGAVVFWRANHPFGDALPGGKGDTRTPLDFDPVEVQRGIKVEMEHTNDWRIAQEIALDHLAEDRAYYHKLARIHKD